LFDAQTEEYRRSMFPPSVRTRLAVEAGATQGWHCYVGEWGGMIGLGSPAWVTGVVMVTALVLWRKRCWFRLPALVLVVTGDMVLDVLLKIAFHRLRPSYENSLLIFQGYSFPSGHPMAATLLYGVLAASAAGTLETWLKKGELNHEYQYSFPGPAPEDG
jgi:hypothetical protein